MNKKVDLLLCGTLLLFSLLTFQYSQAQTAFGLGVGGGLNQRTGFRAALPLEFKLSKSLFLFAEPSFVQRRNQEIIHKLNAGREYFTVELDYVALPAMLKLRLDWEPIRIYGLLGIEISYGARIQATGVEDQRLFKEKLDFAATGISRLDGGLSFGAGFEKDLRRRRKIFADLRYYLGILDIDQSGLGEIYNEGAYITLGFLMPLGQE